MLRRYRDPAALPNQPVSAPLTGNMKSLAVLADYIYQLQNALKTPRKISENPTFGEARNQGRSTVCD